MTDGSAPTWRGLRRLGAWWLCVSPCLAWGLAYCLVCCLPMPAARAQAQAPLEASVKAAYLYKFLAYVEWHPPTPQADDAPVVVGVLGADAVHSELQEVAAGRHVGARPLVVRKLAAGDSLNGLHALFVGREHALAPVARTLQRRQVLLVADVPGGLADGAVINFIVLAGRVRFEASQAAAERAGLKLSSRLLSVAERVQAP
jgi:YfiR/HmsC-like